MIPIFIGFDKRERAATNVLIDSLNNLSSTPLSITLLQTQQLINQGLYKRTRDPNQSTDFSFTRFLVPYLMEFKGWAIFMDCDMLCEDDITDLWKCREERFSVMCVKHEHKPKEKFKFLEAENTQSNWHLKYSAKYELEKFIENTSEMLNGLDILMIG